MMTRDHSGERGWFRRRQPPVPVVRQIVPPTTPAPAPAAPPTPEPDPITVRCLRMWALEADDRDERADILMADWRHAYREARYLLHYDEPTALRWAAYTAGLPLVEGDRDITPWSLGQIARLVHLRETYADG